MPVAVHVVDGESGVDHGIGQLCPAAKAQFTVRDHDLTWPGEDVVTREADPAITHADQLQPALHRPMGRVEPPVRGRVVMPKRIATSEQISYCSYPTFGYRLCSRQKDRRIV
jgi:hypothetical protein